MFAHMEDFDTAVRGKRVDKAFAEKIMLVVTQVNGCRYCSYAHTRAALIAGVRQTELQKLMAGELGEFPENQRVALTFAQHYAESRRQPDPSSLQGLLIYYGPEISLDILAYLRMITFGNLFGNTFDALLSRCRGIPADQSSIISELCVILGGLVIVPCGMVIHLFARLVLRRFFAQNRPDQALPAIPLKEKNP